MIITFDEMRGEHERDGEDVNAPRTATHPAPPRPHACDNKLSLIYNQSINTQHAHKLDLDLPLYHLGIGKT